jgi:hypothetical protein
VEYPAGGIFQGRLAIDHGVKCSRDSYENTVKIECLAKTTAFCRFQRCGRINVSVLQRKQGLKQVYSATF